MALEKFRAPTLPVPPPGPDQQYFTQLLRIIGLYFAQLDSLTPNQAQSYRADDFYGGVFYGDFLGGDVTADNFFGDNFIGVNATLARLYAQNIFGNVQGGDGVFGNLTASQANASLFTGSGRQINFPHIAASDSTDQVAAGNDTPTVIKWNTLDAGLGWTLASDVFTAEFSGVYKITVRLQFVNTANAIHSAVVWLQKEGVDLVNSSTEFSIPARKNASTPSFVCGCSEVTFEAGAGDEIELYWATDLAGNPTTPTDGIYIYHDAAQASPYARPAIPSAIGSIVYLSAPPDPKTQVALVGVVGVGAVGSTTIQVS